jgi:hypothetical protein
MKTNRRYIWVVFLFLCIFTLFYKNVDSSGVINFKTQNINTSENSNQQPQVVPGVVVIKLKKTTNVFSLAKTSTTTGIFSLDQKQQRINVQSVEKCSNINPFQLT